MRAMDHQGIMGIDITGYGNYGWATTTPVRNLDQAKKVKFRTAEAAVNQLLYKQWKINAVVMPWPDVPVALKQGVIEGLDHTPMVCNITKKFEVAKYFTYIDYAQGLFIWVFNKGWFNKLPPDLQKIFVEVVREVCADIREQTKMQEAVQIMKASRNGIQFLTLPEDQMNWLKKRGDAVHQKWAPEINKLYPGDTYRPNNFLQLEYADDIEPERLDEIATETIGPHHMTGCFGCQVHCRAQYRIPSGPHAGKYDEGPEYTSQGAFGSEPECRSAETVLTGNHLVDQYGMDNLEVGSLIAWAMELYELGIINKKQTGGLDLRFGNDEALLEMTERIAFRKGWLANALADGGIAASEKIGKNSFDYLIQVKGMSNLHSDERATPALALNIATASRGSDHLRSRPAIDLYHLPEPVLRKIYSSPIPYEGPLSSEHTSYTGKPWQVFWQENCYMAVDCLGICKYHTVFLGATLPNFEDWPKVIYYNTGLEMTPEEIWEAAERCNMLERMFNLREGLQRNDLKKGDMLNHRYFDEPCRRGAPGVVGLSIDRKKFKQMIDEFYGYKGLDKTGKPKAATLRRLGLAKEPSHLV